MRRAEIVMTEPGSMRASAQSGAVGIVLAGGRSERMGGGDKTLRMLAGRPILAHVLDRAAPQVAALALNANGDPARFGAYSIPVVADSVDGFAGPLSGVLAGMDWAAGAHPTVSWLASFPADAPFLPVDLVERLFAVRRAASADIVCARCEGRVQPVFALWSIALRAQLRDALVSQQIRKVETFMRNFRLAYEDFALGDFDPFCNINTPEDLRVAENWQRFRRR